MTRAQAEQLEAALADWLAEHLPDDSDYDGPNRKRETREVLIALLEGLR